MAPPKLAFFMLSTRSSAALLVSRQTPGGRRLAGGSVSSSFCRLLVEPCHDCAVMFAVSQQLCGKPSAC